jgi:hypothetical protein
VSDGRAPPVGASLSALTPPSLSLAAPWGRPVGAGSLACAHSLSLSRCPHLSVVLNLPSMISPPWMRLRPHVLWPRLCAHAPFEPRALLTHLLSLICTLCQTLSPSLSLYPREQRALPPPADDHCLFCGHRRVRAPSSATVSSALLSAARDTLRCALSLSIASGPRSPEQSSRNRSPAVVAPSSLCASAVASRHQRFPSR